MTYERYEFDSIQRLISICDEGIEDARIYKRFANNFVWISVVLMALDLVAVAYFDPVWAKLFFLAFALYQVHFTIGTLRWRRDIIEAGRVWASKRDEYYRLFRKRNT